MCPVETPEGHSVGIVKNMSLLTSISQHTPSTTVIHYLREMTDIQWITKPQVYEGTSITVNGVIVGYTKDPHTLVVRLRAAKQSRRLHPHISVAWYTLMNSISVETDGGRCVRPVFRTGMTPPQDTSNWNEWCKSSIDYVDSSETETLRIAMNHAEMTPAHTHYEIHPSLIVGHMASTIPLSDHNQSPRNTYQSAMGKQAMGMYALNYRERFDAMAHVLCYPQKAFVTPFLSRLHGAHTMPAGQNVVVAIMTYTGYNQEDSMMINRGALDRGLFRSIFYRTYKDEEKKNQASGEEERFCRPDPSSTKQMRHNNYEKLGADGFIPENAYVNSDDILIGKE
jgi:DNA-directed RNA polymerase II subunit RPB2